MKLLITSGGTTEKIDTVRGITNHSTGRLGAIIAQKFLNQGHDVTLVTTKSAIKPHQHSHLTTIDITTVADLMAVLENEVPKHQVLIHSMAVSDYTPVYMTDFESVNESDDLSQFLHHQNDQGKISSQSDYQVLFLKKTPKVISYVKQWHPQIHLFGFKLLVDVAKEELIKVARESLKKNKADYILANDLKDITDKGHKALLVSETQVEQADTKEAIAQLIYEKVSQL
ncbi:phosphopantothenate--cysteine ligase [Streptococcus ictaluri]|uniref:Phosphopantothenate--cysteine ligase n=1 Tax=Streptococcus ictaluri 707-05 TaxID=764299 RepID=G5K2X8_9STRE|nr:phosphopantothenate--cysteine ligase [Streptococcus ictaluri]EHI69762.1 phosphopantothenate--cysteine ligase [Streptococcus ictaluri 707-05]